MMINFLRLGRCAMLPGCFFAASLAHATDATLCKAKETPVFSCKLKNAKVVSICASPDAARGYVDYRFGTGSRLELTYSANVSLPDHRFHRGEVVYANNSDDLIWFSNGAYRYSVYSPTRGGPGLTVTRNGDEIGRFECTSGGRGMSGELTTASPYITDHGTGDLKKFKSLWGEKD